MNIKLFLGEHINTRISKDVYFHKVIQPFHYFLFNDFEFVKLYIQHLDQFTQEDYVQRFLEKYNSEIKTRASFINQTYPACNFKSDVTFKNPKWIQQIIHPSDNASIDRTVPVRRYSILPSTNFKYLFCKTLGAFKVKRFAIFNWSIPNENITSAKPSINSILAHPLMSVDDNKVIRISPKLKWLEKVLIIPKAYSLRIPAGASIDLGEGVSIVAYGPIFMEGNSLNPILITSSARGHGLLVLNSAQESKFSHCTFQNFKARHKGIQITEGGLSFYDTKMSFKNCNFENSKSKDAINLIETDYIFQQCNYVNINGDGIDANNSIGSIETASFKNIGKDAIEVSGGSLDMESIIIDQANGNGVNVSWNVKVEILKSLSITNSKQGTSASELAELQVENITLNNVKKGFVLFQKLASYGSAKVTVNSFKMNKVDKLHIIDQKAKLILNNQTMVAN